MKSKILVTSMVLAGLMTVGSAAQAQSVNVTVIGKIVPAACVPVLAGSGIVDYGSIAASTLNMTKSTVLTSKDVAFTITCAADTRVALSSVDNRSASMVPGILSVLTTGTFTDSYNFGLGTVSGANVGGFAMRYTPTSLTTDGVTMKSLSSADSGKTWTVSGGGVMKAPSQYAHGLTAAAGPVAGKVFAGTLNIQTVLNKGSALPLTGDVPLDGSATMSLVYL